MICLFVRSLWSIRSVWSVYPLVFLSACLVALSGFLSLFLSLWHVCLSVCSVCLSVGSVFLSVSLSVCLVCLVCLVSLICLSGVWGLFCQFSLSGSSIVLLFLSDWSVCLCGPSVSLISLSVCLSVFSVRVFFCRSV